MMRVFKDLINLPALKNTVLTVGTFDGVHHGHQKLIQRLNNRAKDIDGESLIVTFHPHPRIVVQTEPNIQLLNTIDEKIELLTQYGVQNLVIVAFNRNFSNQSPEKYINDFLVRNFSPKIIVIGYNHQFGKNRAGNINLLNEYAKTNAYSVEEISKQQIEDMSVSSTKIRQYLTKGQIEKANELLGHPYTLKGIVIKGEQIGATIGFPTANLQIEEPAKLIPNEGIYAVLVKRNETLKQGMLYIGNRPTLQGKNRSIEVNIFDFKDDLYGETLKIYFIKKIREDQYFVSIEKMIEAMHQDKIEALDVLNKYAGKQTLLNQLFEH